MRLLFEPLRAHVTWIRAINPATLFAGGGVVLAAVVVVYGALLGSGRPPDEAVTVSGPVFTPVATTSTTTAVHEPARAGGPATASAEAIPRFEDERSVTRAVQAELKRAGCYSGPVNGIWTASTQAGMGEFTRRVNARLPVDRPDPVLLALLETHSGDGCVPRAAAPAAQRAEARQDTGDLGAIAAERAPGLSVPTETTSTAREDGTARVVAAATAAAGAAAGQATQKASTPRPQRAARSDRKQPSLARQVSDGFRQIQRSLDALF